jgi:Arc/MetJ-type ribon-helix-helix transcriptional regulator
MGKVQISITIDDDQLKWIDQAVEDHTFATRSHAIVYAVAQLMKQKAEMSER